MKKEQLEELITSYVLGELNEDESREVEALLEQDERCRALREDVEATLGLLRDAMASNVSAPEDLDEAHQDALSREARGTLISWPMFNTRLLANAAAITITIGALTWIAVRLSIESERTDRAPGVEVALVKEEKVDLDAYEEKAEAESVRIARLSAQPLKEQAVSVPDAIDFDVIREEEIDEPENVVIADAAADAEELERIEQQVPALTRVRQVEVLQAEASKPVASPPPGPEYALPVQREKDRPTVKKKFENPFVRLTRDRSSQGLTTMTGFRDEDDVSVDVREGKGMPKRDVAAYDVIVEALSRGALPAPGSVDVSALINHFTYDLAGSDSRKRVRVQAELAVSPIHEGLHTLMVGVRFTDSGEERFTRATEEARRVNAGESLSAFLPLDYVSISVTLSPAHVEHAHPIDSEFERSWRFEKNVPARRARSGKDGGTYVLLYEAALVDGVSGNHGEVSVTHAFSKTGGQFDDSTTISEIANTPSRELLLASYAAAFANELNQPRKGSLTAELIAQIEAMDTDDDRFLSLLELMKSAQAIIEKSGDAKP